MSNETLRFLVAFLIGLPIGVFIGINVAKLVFRKRNKKNKTWKQVYNDMGLKPSYEDKKTDSR